MHGELKLELVTRAPALAPATLTASPPIVARPPRLHSSIRWGAHAPRVLVSGPPPRRTWSFPSKSQSPTAKAKFVAPRATQPARDGACAPRSPFLDPFTSHVTRDRKSVV